ncbi:MAG: hypothetical protein MJZ61_04000 [Bacteroidales bacterium]|nr:hypothetical protein [Bacteroidales bacterium]
MSAATPSKEDFKKRFLKDFERSDQNHERKDLRSKSPKDFCPIFAQDFGHKKRFSVDFLQILSAATPSKKI